MQLWVGLGNPGATYALHRHNVGFMAVDAIAETHGFGAETKKFKGLVREGRIGSARILILKPQTFMNESGRSVAEAQRFHKIALADVIVLHDELDLVPAKVRLKLGGGNAGHNGLRSITAQCGNDFRRVRIGIGHPGDKALVHAYVLNDFGKLEQPWVQDLCRAVADHAELLATGDDASFQNKVHLAMAARGWDDVKALGRPD